jgi:adenosylcobinamide-GDP ribazoletransferase
VWPEILAAVGLLTRVPVAGGAGRAGVDRSGAAAFGLVGGAIGLIGAVVLTAVSPIARVAAPVLALVAIAVVSGGLHLDGLGDTADALAAPTAEAAERARQDPRAGPAGIGAIAALLALDWSFLVELEARGWLVAPAALVVAASVSRSVGATTPAVARLPLRAGLGAWFAARTTAVDGAISGCTSVALAAVLAVVLERPTPVIVAALGLVIGWGAVLILERLRGGLDGDALGAITEITLAGALFAAIVAA